MTGIQKSVSSYEFLQRDATRQRQMRQQAQDYFQVGRFLVPAITVADESTATVSFPNIFVEEPFFTFGSVMDLNSPVVVGSAPTASATVSQWDTVVNGPFSGYIGATLSVVTTGIITQRIWINYMFFGKALTFNAGSTATGGDITA